MTQVKSLESRHREVTEKYEKDLEMFRSFSTLNRSIDVSIPHKGPDKHIYQTIDGTTSGPPTKKYSQGGRNA